MSAEVKTEFRIPDLWYDFYARLIPGTAFIVALRIFSFNNKSVPESNEIFMLLGAAYFAGLMTQPLASRLVSKIDDFAQWIYSKEKEAVTGDNWTRKLQFQLGRTSRDSLILSKMHGETTMFVQIGVLSIVFIIQNILKIFKPFGESYTKVECCLGATIIIIFSLIFAIEVAHRKLKRAARIKKYLDEGIIKPVIETSEKNN